MFTHSRGSVLICVLLLCCFTLAKEKKGNKSSTLPDIVVNAQTVAVVIMPGVPEPITNPNANRDAQNDVENALTKWGRLRPMNNAQDADLVIAVRKGIKGATPTVRGGGVDDRPVILQPNEGDLRIGVERGTPPSNTRNETPPPQRPQLGAAVGTSEDIFEVYLGHTRYPLDGALLWRYHEKEGLNPPIVPAVAAFRKALEQAIQQRKQSGPPNKP